MVSIGRRKRKNTNTGTREGKKTKKKKGKEPTMVTQSEKKGGEDPQEYMPNDAQVEDRKKKGEKEKSGEEGKKEKRKKKKNHWLKKRARGPKRGQLRHDRGHEKLGGGWKTP